MSEKTSNKRIGIIGSGIIGKSWAMLFASREYYVTLYDVNSNLVDAALKDIQVELQRLESSGNLKGSLTAELQMKFISGARSLEECLEGKLLVQECVPEVLTMKRNLYTDVDKILSDKTILSSSTSTFLPSVLSEGLHHASNLIVSHPVNPPYFVPLVEIVPSDKTSAWVVTQTRAIMEDIGQSAVVLNREVPGFALNRIQYAILNECWHLVASGVMSVKDVDKVMSDGLGMRYAFLGPLETAHLNAQGFEDYCRRYSESMYSVCQTFSPAPKFSGEQVKSVAEQLNQMLPVEKFEDRKAWRDKALCQLSKLKKNLKSD